MPDALRIIQVGYFANK